MGCVWEHSSRGNEEIKTSATLSAQTLSFTLIGNCHILGKKPASGATQETFLEQGLRSGVFWKRRLRKNFLRKQLFSKGLLLGILDVSNQPSFPCVIASSFPNVKE